MVYKPYKGLYIVKTLLLIELGRKVTYPEVTEPVPSQKTPTTRPARSTFVNLKNSKPRKGNYQVYKSNY